MNTVSFKATGGLRASLLVTLVAAAGAALAADQPKGPAVSAALQKPLAEVQALLKDNKFPEALDKLRGDPRLAGEMGRRGRTRAIRRFGPALYLRRLLDVYALSAGEAIEPAGELAVGAIGQHDARQK